MDLKQNSGVIFKNTKKPEGSKQPDYRGEIDCEGVRKEIALWLSESTSGTKYFSVKISDPYQKPEPVIPPPISEQTGEDLPF